MFDMFGIVGVIVSVECFVCYCSCWVFLTIQCVQSTSVCMLPFSFCFISVLFCSSICAKRYETVNIFVVYRYLQSWTGFPNPGIHDWGFYNGPHSIIAYIIASVLWCCWLGWREGIRPVKNWVVGCWHGYLSGARCRLAYGLADATATHWLLFQ